jgi:hypothetical protein
MQTATGIGKSACGVNRTASQFLSNPEDFMPDRHSKVPATSANCEADYRAKVKLNAEFKDFKTRVKKAAKTSRDIKELIIPLVRLEKAIKVAAWGRHLVATKDDRS